MFEQTMVDGTRTRSPWGFAASITVQSVLVAAALSLPMLRVAKMDTKPDVLFLPRPIGAADSTRQATSRNAATSALSVPQVKRTYRPFQAPSTIPTRVATGPDAPGAEYAFGDPPGAGVPDGAAIGGLPELGQKLLTVPPPELPRHAQQPAARPAPIQVSEGVQAAKLAFGPKPAYPPLAKQARISGAVQLSARISSDGHIQDLRVMSGHPMLVSAALEAVKQWVYKPTLLNGKPVEVLTEIVVNFVLNQ